MADDDYEIYLMVKVGTLDDMCAYVEERNDVVMFEKNGGVFIWHKLGEGNCLILFMYS